MTRPPVSRRQRRIGELVQAEISRLLLRGLKDRRIALVTSITQVDVSPDLRHAKVYVSVLGTDQEKANTLVALRNARGFLQAELGKALRLRYTPQLRFVPDARIEEGDHILALMKQLGLGEGDVASDEEDTSAEE